MRIHSLRSKLLIAVSALVILSSALVSLLVTQRYSQSIFNTARAQAENLAHTLALEAADKILIHDLVGLQKMLDGQMTSNPFIAYLFVIRNKRVLAHTFINGMPVDLIQANTFLRRDFGHSKKIASKQGELFLDIAWPVFEGKAGVLRMGLSQKPFQQQVMQLRLQMGLLTIVILLVALIITFLFIQRVTGPIKALAKAAADIAEGDLKVDIPIKGQDEVGKLTAAFEQMVNRIQKYTQRLKDQSTLVTKAHDEMQVFCSIIKQIGAQNTLDGVGSFLLRELQVILDSHAMVLLVFSSHRDILFRLSTGGTIPIKETQTVRSTTEILENLEGITIAADQIFTSPLIPEDFPTRGRQTVIPLLAKNQIEGALVLVCETQCRCEERELLKVELILEQASGTIKRAILHEEEIRDLHKRIKSTAEYSGIIGRDPKMQDVYKLIEDIAATDATALIQGESGTGKELVASAIHDQSPRKDKPFVVINCSAYPATLLESELFGHEKGAFTGATRQKIGRFEMANGGTVFLDEIGEIPPSAQVKLLRVLQTHKFERVGGEKTLNVDVRIIAATNKDLLQEVKRGQFREDLYYRLNVIPIHTPPLRERSNDIPLLAQHFLARFTAEQEKNIREFSSEAMRRLLSYAWPGNVRELKNSIEHSVVLAKNDQIEVSHLPSALLDKTADQDGDNHGTLVDYEKKLLIDTLTSCGWNKKLTAHRLGINRSTLYNKLKKYKITNPTIH